MGFVKGTLQILGTVCKPHLKFGGFPSQKPLKNQSKFKKSKNHYFSRTLNILKSIVYQQKVLKPNSLLKLNEKKLPHFSGFESILLAFTTKSPNLMVRRMTRNHPNLPTRTTPYIDFLYIRTKYDQNFRKFQNLYMNIYNSEPLQKMNFGTYFSLYIENTFVDFTYL